MRARLATYADRAEIARIYNAGIAERIATFETRDRTAKDIGKWMDGKHPVIVVGEPGRIFGFAATFPYSARECYAGVAEFSVYVDRNYRGRGVGKFAMNYLIEQAAAAGFHKLLSRIFVENAASLKLMKSLGFREVGVYRNHAKLDGIWRDVVIVEYLIERNL
ncbi:MAG: arsinothricin resistance N-acetyltransferase ArsN1 family A [Calditrichia bacterium]